MSIVSLLVVVLLLCLCIWVIRTLCGAFGVGEPITTVIYVILVVVVVLWIVQSLGLIGGGPVLRL